MLSNKISAKDAEAELLQSPSKLEYQQAMSDNLNGHQLNSRILSYKNKPPAGPEGMSLPLKTTFRICSEFQPVAYDFTTLMLLSFVHESRIQPPKIITTNKQEELYYVNFIMIY